MPVYMEEHLDMPLRDVLSIVQDRLMQQSTYFGVKALKSPMDHWVYQEIVCQQRPDVIVEIGNMFGGGLYHMAHVCDLLGHGRIIGVDVSHANISEEVARHPRIRLIEGDACDAFDSVKRLISTGEKVLVIEDSSHTYDNTLEVLRAYSPLVPVGGYFIVEDGICHHGLDVGPNPGPFEAVEAFVEENDGFAIDRSRESFLITWNPKGYLKRVK